MSTLYYESSFAHHGVKGQKWGVRRYQNPDGSLTFRGRHRYLDVSGGYTADGYTEMRKRVDNALKKDSKVISDNHRIDLNAAYNEYSKVVEPINELMNNPKLTKEFGSKALRIFLDETKSDPNMYELRDYVGSELDYGPNSTVALYYKSKGVSYEKLKKDYKNAFNKIENASSKVTDDILNSFGDKVVSKIDSKHNNTRRDTEIYLDNAITNQAFKTMRFKWDDTK